MVAGVALPSLPAVVIGFARSHTLLVIHDHKMGHPTRRHGLAELQQPDVQVHAETTRVLQFRIKSF